ncbi:MAG TPA: hypothetical protein VKF36_12275 [Syntrophorhabdales bacterium]|nr:hypothetical protein [Syntrophorhabdales bacterium]
MTPLVQLEAAVIGGRVIIKPATVKELGDVIQEALGGMGEKQGQALRHTVIAPTFKNTGDKGKTAVKKPARDILLAASILRSGYISALSRMH